jgi:formate dehydrogenase major subunit
MAPLEKPGFASAELRMQKPGFLFCWAMDRIAHLIKETRDATFEEKTADGKVVNRTMAIASLGGATLDNEGNYLIKKPFGGALGVVWIENQARV